MQDSHQSTKIKAHIVNGFTAGDKGGNPAGVVLDADNLDEEDMLQIATKIGLSETAFVSKSKTEGFKLDFFTPNMRIAHCGHATIATFSYLAELGRVQEGETSKETVDGPRKIIIKEGAAYMEQKAPKYSTSKEWALVDVTKDAVLNSLGLTEEDLDSRVGPMLVNTGNSFIVTGVKSADVLKGILPDQDAIAGISEKLDLIGYYVFTTDTSATEHDATTRMFAPRYAILEESATGMAGGPLACLLHDYLDIKKDVIIIDQGHFMETPSPSIINVELDKKDGKITGLMAGGYGRSMKEMEIDLETAAT